MSFSASTSGIFRCERTITGDKGSTAGRRGRSGGSFAAILTYFQLLNELGDTQLTRPEAPLASNQGPGVSSRHRDPFLIAFGKRTGNRIPTKLQSSSPVKGKKYP